MEQVSNQHTTGLQSFSWKDFFSFRRMIALQLIQVIYIIVAILITISALAIMFKGESSYYDRSVLPGGFFSGFLLLIFGNVFWRLWCEFMIVIFRINSTLNNIDETTRKHLTLSLPPKQ